MRQRLSIGLMAMVFWLASCGSGGEANVQAVQNLVLNHSYSAAGITFTVTAFAPNVDPSTVPLAPVDQVLGQRLVRLVATLTNTTDQTMDIEPRLHTTQRDGTLAGNLDLPPDVIDTVPRTNFSASAALRQVGHHQQVTHTYYYGFDPRLPQMTLYLNVQASGATQPYNAGDLFILTFPGAATTSTGGA